MYAGPDAFTGSDSQRDEKHGDKEQGDRKRDFIDGDVTRHLHAVTSDLEVNARCIEVTENVLELSLDSEM